MKKQKQMQKAFGTNAFGLIYFPVKISNVQVSRIVVLKRNAPFVFHMDGRQVTQRGLLTDRETGNTSEKQDGSHLKRKAGLLRPFRYYAILLFLPLDILF